MRYRLLKTQYSRRIARNDAYRPVLSAGVGSQDSFSRKQRPAEISVTDIGTDDAQIPRNPSNGRVVDPVYAPTPWSPVVPRERSQTKRFQI